MKRTDRGQDRPAGPAPARHGPDGVDYAQRLTLTQSLHTTYTPHMPYSHTYKEYQTTLHKHCDSCSLEGEGRTLLACVTDMGMCKLAVVP